MRIYELQANYPDQYTTHVWYTISLYRNEADAEIDAEYLRRFYIQDGSTYRVQMRPAFNCATYDEELGRGVPFAPKATPLAALS